MLEGYLEFAWHQHKRQLDAIAAPYPASIQHFIDNQFPAYTSDLSGHDPNPEFLCVSTKKASQ